jgi:preprotein translocase subunit YajC
MFTNAFAQATTQAPSGATNIFLQLVPFLLIFVVMYFMMIRPQQKKAQEMRNMHSNLKRNDRILMASGIIGVVVKVEEQELTVDIADGVHVKILKSAVAQVISKGVKSPSEDKDPSEIKGSSESKDSSPENKPANKKNEKTNITPIKRSSRKIVKKTDKE